MEPIAHVGVVQAAASVDGGMAVRGAGGGGGGDEMGAEAMTMAVDVAAAGEPAAAAAAKESFALRLLAGGVAVGAIAPAAVVLGGAEAAA